MSPIFHILKRSSWELAQKVGVYSPSSLTQEGFIHFSERNQVTSVANAFYRGVNGLIILKIDKNLLEATLKYEAPLESPSSKTLFPHLYGELNLNAVVGTIDFPCENDGSFMLPEL